MKSNVAVRRSSLGKAVATLLAAVSSSYCRLLITSSSVVVVVSLQQSSSTTCASASTKRSIRHHICSPITITSSSTSLLHSNNDAYSSVEEEGRRGRKKRLEKLQKQRRRNRWMKRYGTVEALKQTFGTGPPWGDLSPTQTRSLYHTLLPRSLLALNEMGFVTAEDLAPLAYEARIAAKEYARSRCVWTGRVGVFLFDQYRSLRDKGRLIQPGKSSSMSWEEIWAKYEGQILKEHAEKKKKGGMKVKELDEDELMMQTYMRILERSCSTNQTFDKLFLHDKEGGNDGGGNNGDISLASIASQLDHDVRTILLSPSEISKVEKKVKKMEKKQLKEREKEEKMQRKADRKRRRSAKRMSLDREICE
jgi:hypothetical protein